MNLEGVAAMEELARQMQSNVDAYNVPDSELDSVLWFRQCDGHGSAAGVN